MNVAYYQEVAVRAAKAGAVELVNAWKDLLRVETKDRRGDLVTNADLASEKAILRVLHTETPDISVMAEESGRDALQSHLVWVVDPLDGTTNYVHHVPIVGVSIGLVNDGQPVLGVIYQPFSDELFVAADGLGASLNGDPIRVSHTPDLADSLLATGFAYDRTEVEDTNYPEFCHLTHITQGVRRLGAASIDLAYVACGRFDGYWERGLKPWDIAAGAVLVREAGGKVSDYNKQPMDLSKGRILATNGKLHTPLSETLAAVR